VNQTDTIKQHFRLQEHQKEALKRLGIETVRDLLYYFPSRYSDISEIKLVGDLQAGEIATVYGTISKLKTKKSFRTKVPMAEGVLEDESGQLKITWFNQAFLAKVLHEGQRVSLTGKITSGKYGVSMSNPEVNKTSYAPADVHDTLFKNKENIDEEIRFPVYPETKGLTSKWIYHTVQKIVASGLVKETEDYIPETILKQYNLPKLSSALVWIHMPKKASDAEAARKRFAFEEVFFIQLSKARDRKENETKQSYRITSTKKEISSFIERLGFALTDSQEKAVNTIMKDMNEGRPMSRLLEGDVGSGKTAVAATVANAVITNRPPDLSQGKPQSFGNLQVALMAPTEILATQHFESFTKLFKGTPIQIGLLTGTGAKKFPSKVGPDPWTNISKAQLLKWVKNGEIPILIGTHALIYKSVSFKDLALAIVDEQHRFGTKQRAKLSQKEGFAPHYLSMTATPIPRTLTLTIYGDLDLTLLDGMPPGRKPVKTELVAPDNRDKTYDFIKTQMYEGRQLYVICPRINEPDPDKENALQMKSVKEEAKRLKENVFQDKQIDILHSKMTKIEKEKVMERFAKHQTDILVATSVVEVGVNVPNATMIIIEGAERFGLAQLHQLRGRVVRSTHQAYCFVFTDTNSAKSLDRLKALQTAKNGFELSELDLSLRGAGDLAGTKQWGITDLGMEAIKNLKMVEAAREEAKKIVETNALAKYPILQKEFELRDKKIHFE
jgi:ATP-dependent DNA helicase RecG